MSCPPPPPPMPMGRRVGWDTRFGRSFRYAPRSLTMQWLQYKLSMNWFKRIHFKSNDNLMILLRRRTRVHVCLYPSAHLCKC